jgi:uncharacterized membrane protein YeaQ/YmgE (transglycosylase-associated protein family)
MSILWTIIIGFVAGVIAKLLHPGNKCDLLDLSCRSFCRNIPWPGSRWYQAGESAGFIGAIVGAIIVLVVWGVIAPRLQRT